MTSSPVLLLLGAGPKLGTQIPKVFSEAGYKIALVARSLPEGLQDNGYYHIRADFNNAESIPEVFEKVKQNLGIPTVVVYNAVQYKLDDIADPFSSMAPENVSNFLSAVSVNGTTPMVALHHAIASFRSLPAGSTVGTFIFTGNILNHSQFKNRMCFGMAKTLCAYGIRFASVAYEGQGFT
jgi:NAD(P)-dependent dehydrogenase (short-subunit alcohol dehydrogenase family)